MTTSALRPMVSSGSIIWRIEDATAAVWVAPISLAFSSLKGTGSTAMMCRAPAMRAPWMAPEPTPPQPITTTVSPGFTLARSTAEPKPVAMPQLMSAAAFMLSHGSMRTSEFSWHDHLVGEGAELRHAVQVLAAQVVAVGAVADHAARQRHHPEVAQVLASRGTPVTRPTRGDERHGDVVTLRHLRHVGPDLGDDARALVAADHREHGLHAHHLEHLGRLADVARAQVLVGVAHARPDHLHPDLAVARRVDLDLFGLPGLVEPACTPPRASSSLAIPP